MNTKYAISLTLSLIFIFSVSIANADQDTVPTAATAPYQTSVISPTSGYVLYGWDDGTS